MGHGTGGRTADSSARFPSSGHCPLRISRVRSEEQMCLFTFWLSWLSFPSTVAKVALGGAVLQLAPFHRRQHPSSRSQSLNVAPRVAFSRLERRSLSPFSYLVLASVRNTLLIMMFFLSNKVISFMIAFPNGSQESFMKMNVGFRAHQILLSWEGKRWRRPSLSLRSPKNSHGS